MSRDPFFANAQAERQAGQPTWKPKVACSGCGLLTGTYSRIAGRSTSVMHHQNPDMTPDRYEAELDAWVDAWRAWRRTQPEGADQ